jgi:hypothetical protein
MSVFQQQSMTTRALYGNGEERHEEPSGDDDDLPIDITPSPVRDDIAEEEGGRAEKAGKADDQADE